MLNLTLLAAQGRAKSATEPWQPEEWNLVHELETTREIARTTAADFVRNGITSVAEYDKAIKNKFVPLTADEALKEVGAMLVKKVKKAVKGKKK